MTGANQIGGIAADTIKQTVDRVERLRDEIKALNADIAEVYKQAKSLGLDVSVIKEIIKLRAKDPSARNEFEQLLGLYMHALGMDVAHVHAREAA